MRAQRLSFLFLLVGTVAMSVNGCRCGDPVTDGGVDSGPDGTTMCSAATESCTTDVDCCTGNYCDTTAMACAALKADGTTCTAGTECLSANCYNGSCSSCTLDGNACGAGSDCCSTVCDTAGSGQCVSCSLDGTTCLAGSDCCSGTCFGSPTKVCTTCLADTMGCGAHSECCSDNCDAGTCQTVASSVGTGCALDSECRTNFCDTGLSPAACSCKQVGDTTASGPEQCCSGNWNGVDTCTVRADNPCTPAGETGTAATCCSSYANADGVCENPAFCSLANDVCFVNDDCCSGVCDRPSGATIGSCLTHGGGKMAGEPCNPGKNASCASGICLNWTSTIPTCYLLDGCRPESETCKVDADCCSSNCQATSSVGADGQVLMACGQVTFTPTCSLEGELCSNAGGDCCPSGGGKTGCELIPIGVERCLGGGPCTALGSTTACTDVSECCTTPNPNVQCTNRVVGGTPSVDSYCCLADGQDCSLNAQCCAGVCKDDGTGNLKCGSCSTAGQACGANSDCCMGCCDSGTCGDCPTNCLPLGSLCSTGSDCCGYVDGTSSFTTGCLGTEFKTCAYIP